MLNLLHAYTGWPTEISQLSLTRDSLLLYPSGDTVVILDGGRLSLVQVLAFWEAFPAAENIRGRVKVVVADGGLKIVLASMGSQIAFWTVEESKKDWHSLTTKVHSTLSLGEEVTAADCKSGLLAVGTTTSLSVYTLTLQNDIPTWIKKWEVAVPMLSQIVFSPSLTHIASLSSAKRNVVRLHLTAVPRETQFIKHPRPVVTVIWRAPKSHSRPDLTLYSLTSDSTLRIFHPVLDAPQRLQLHAALDSTSFLPSPLATQLLGSYIFPLDREILLQSIADIFQPNGQARVRENSNEEKNQLRKLEEIKNEEWDLFLRVLKDGSIVIRGLANIDRRPPTLLRQFTLLHTPPSTLSLSRPPSQLYLTAPLRDPHSKVPTAHPSELTLTTCPPLTTHSMEPKAFFDAQRGVKSSVINDFESDTWDAMESEASPIERLVRTADGRGVAVVRQDCVEAWALEEQGQDPRLKRLGGWKGKGDVVILDEGRTTVSLDSDGNVVTIRRHGDKIEETLSVPLLESLFALPSTESYTLILGITKEHSIAQIHVPSSSSKDQQARVLANTSLPLPEPPSVILPVDPMAWSSNGLSMERDVLVSISEDGLLSFWVPEGYSENSNSEEKGKWRCTGSVHTERRNIRLARCSSAKKTVLVALHPDGEEITIWDSKESKFSTGLEYRHIVSHSEPIKDLDWTSTSDAESVLAVGYAHHVLLLSQQRMTYFEQEPAWGIFGKVDISHLTPYDIGDSIWLSGGSLLIAAGHQMFHFGQEIVSKEGNPEASLFQLVAAKNAPLVDYHPQMMLQCLLWEKLEYVKEVIVRFAKGLKEMRERGDKTLIVKPFLVHHMLEKQEAQITKGTGKQYSALFGINGTQSYDEDPNAFSRDLVERLLKLLETGQVPGLTANEQAHLIVLIQTTLEVDEQRRALDSNGLRYLISMRSFYILNQRATSPKNKETAPQGRQRLRYRDMVWAFHSESQEILLSASTAACGGKMTWDDAKALGIYIWMENNESLRSHMETIARNEYMAGENRDPTACSLLYFALGKVRLVHGLWRQAAWHKEQAIMLKFLSNDFQEPRWKTAALKNAFALLGKQRFAYAAAFFILGGSLKDAVNVCIRNLDDVQLGIALARVVEQGDDGPVFQDLLKRVVVPLAFKTGNRYFASWAFWKMHRRDLAVRVLVVPLVDLAASLTEITIADIGVDEHYDDPSLALLFSQLKSKTLQTAKGTSEISGRTEFMFIHQMSRVFCRMGCHVLALDLTASWSFERPELPQRRHTLPTEPSSSPTEIKLPTIHRPFGHLRRRSSMVIDMDIPSIPPTEPASPTKAPAFPTTVIPEETVLKSPGVEVDVGETERQKGLGSLLKTAKQDVSVPEFDMNAFF